MVFGMMLDSKSRDCRHCSLCKMSCSTSKIPVWKEDEAHGSGVCAGTEQQRVKGCGTESPGTVQCWKLSCSEESCCQGAACSVRCLLAHCSSGASAG